jgi:hypothetical protein
MRKSAGIRMLPAHADNADAILLVVQQVISTLSSFFTLITQLISFFTTQFGG